MDSHWLLPSLTGIPAFLVYILSGSALLVVFGAIFIKLTAHDEIALIRAGNSAAAVSFGGAIVGFSLPLSRAVSQAGHIPDLLIWAGLALIVQFGAYLVAQRLVPEISGRIAGGDMAAATLLAALSVASGLLNAAAMTV